VKNIGFCASDVKILRGKHPFAKYPLIPGHEFSGEVTEVGDGCTFKKGDRVAVLGAGTIGLFIIQVAMSRDANVLLATDQFDNRLRIAKEFGVTNTINVTKENPMDVEERKPGEYNTIFDCVGTEDTFRQAVDLTCSGGRIILVGLPVREWSNIPITEFFRKELDLIVTRVYNRAEFKLAIDLLSKGIIDTSRIVTHRLNIANLKDALLLMEHSQESAIKIVLSP